MKILYIFLVLLGAWFLIDFPLLELLAILGILAFFLVFVAVIVGRISSYEGHYERSIREGREAKEALASKRELFFLRINKIVSPFAKRSEELDEVIAEFQARDLAKIDLLRAMLMLSLVDRACEYFTEQFFDPYEDYLQAKDCLKEIVDTADPKWLITASEQLLAKFEVPPLETLAAIGKSNPDWIISVLERIREDNKNFSLPYSVAVGLCNEFGPLVSEGVKRAAETSLPINFKVLEDINSEKALEYVDTMKILQKLAGGQIMLAKTRNPLGLAALTARAILENLSEDSANRFLSKELKKIRKSKIRDIVEPYCVHDREKMYPWIDQSIQDWIYKKSYDRFSELLHFAEILPHKDAKFLERSLELSESEDDLKRLYNFPGAVENNFRERVSIRIVAMLEASPWNENMSLRSLAMENLTGHNFLEGLLFGIKSMKDPEAALEISLTSIMACQYSENTGLVLEPYDYEDEPGDEKPFVGKTVLEAEWKVSKLFNIHGDRNLIVQDVLQSIGNDVVLEHIEYSEQPETCGDDYIEDPVFCDDDVSVERINSDYYYLRDGVRLHENEYQFSDIEGLEMYWEDCDYFGISHERPVTRLEFKLNGNDATTLWLNVKKKDSIEKVLKAIFQD